MDNFNQLTLKTPHASNEAISLNDREFSNMSETIAKDIIEKLISYTVTISYQNDIERKVPEKCWNYMQKILDDFIHLEYISHERDDINLNLNSNMNIVSNTSQLNQNFNSFFNSNLNLDKKLNMTEENITNQNMFRHFNRMEKENMKIFKSDKDNFAVLNEFDTFENDNGENNMMDFGGGFKGRNESDSNRVLFFDNKFEGFNFWSSVKEPVTILSIKISDIIINRLVVK